MAHKQSNIEFFETGFSQTKRFRLLIVLWLLSTTAVFLLITNGLTIFEILESVFLTGVVCYFSYYRVQYFEKNNLYLLIDLIKVICLSLLIIIFGHLGTTYSVFLLVIIIINSFSYLSRDFWIVFGVVIGALLYIWLLLNNHGDEHTLIEKTVFLMVPYFVFATGIISRVFAHELLGVKKQEKELEISKADIKRDQNETTALLDNMENAIISLNKEGTIYFANKSAQNIFPTFVGKTASKVSLDKLHLVDATGRQITLKEVIENSGETSYRTDLSATVGNKLLNLNVLITKIFGDKKNYEGCMISLHNLTADEIVEKSKVEFASLASHEIRTPLTVLEGYLYMMLVNKDFKYDGMTKEYLTMLHDSTSDLIKLANDILSMSRIDEGTVRVSIEKTDLGNLIKETVSEELKLAKLKGLSIDYTLDKIPTIETDQIKVREILRNLIGNAIKFSVKGTISVQLEQDGKEIVISVQDSGIGIPVDLKDKIFNKFFQVENWETRKNSGSGLGLYISKSLAKRIGGDLILESTAQKGSRFSLILPVKYPHPEDLKKHEDRELKEFIKGF